MSVCVAVESFGDAHSFFKGEKITVKLNRLSME